MFSGIVCATGRVVAVGDGGCDRRLHVEPGVGVEAAVTGASIAVNGVCLTVAARNSRGFASDVSSETLSCTTLGDLEVGDAVNLEPALQASARLDGHFVSGHVDGVGEIASVAAAGGSRRVEIRFPPALARYLARKGAVCVDGVSLTINDVGSSSFSANLIPYTLEATTLRDRAAGDRVNIEVDMLARYLERLLETR